MGKKIVSGIVIFVSAFLLLTFGAFTASIGAETLHDKTTDAMGETAGSFELFESPTTKSLFKVAWKPDGSYALLIARDPHTYGAEIFKFDGNSCRLLLNDSNIIIQDVSWNPNGSYALFTAHYYADENHRYKILKYDGDYFSTIQEGGTDDMIAMDWKPDGSYALIVGGSWDAGMVWKYDGNSLTSISDSSFSKFILVDWKPDGSYALIVDFFGAVCKFDGTTFTKLSEVYTTPEHDVGWSADGSYALITGFYALEWDGHPVMLKFDGIQFTDVTYQTGTTNCLYGISSSITGGTLVVGGGGTVLKYDGSIFTKLTEGVYGRLIDVAWKPSYNRALIVGDETILLYTPASEELIYIRADGSIVPLAPISTVDNITYTFTDNIYDSIVVERDNIVIDGAGYTLQGTGSGTGITLPGRSNVTIKNAQITAFEFGIYLSDFSSNNSIVGNNITANNADGIVLYSASSNNNSIVGNNITNNDDGIILHGSSYNSISRNNITNNGGYGIVLDYSSNNTLRSNNMAGNRFNFKVWSGTPSGFVNDVDVSNTVDGKPIYYWINKQDLTVPLDAGCVVLVGCTRITVQNLNLTNNGQGILLANSNNTSIRQNNITNNGVGIYLSWSSYNSSSSNSISGNNITNNVYGIGLLSSSNNSIVRNNITNNNYGIWLSFSPNNKFYHNNFIDNTQQVYFYANLSHPNVWDNGYPSDGNYWSDYMGADVKSGPYQDQLGSDGIGDTPYIIDTDNRDKYPLMKPYGAQHGIGITGVATSKTVVGQGYNVSISVTAENQGDYTETFNVTVYANTTAIETQKITLTSGNSTTITFTWNTTAFPYGNYTISAVADTVLDETYTTDNTYADGTVTVAMAGDLNTDGKASILDISMVATAFGSKIGDPRYNPNADINNDGVINILDISIVAVNFGKTAFY